LHIYVVGGAVRDELLGLPVYDRDYVVVGATPKEMIDHGFLPVGRDFPVFLHPKTREEYALARTERKTAKGYAGFTFHASPDVTLEQDLMRRDLTINAMAQDIAGGELIDPSGGRADLAARVFRHVGPAFVEDPVRLLRLARFSARLADFNVAPETFQLLRSMVKNGEVDALVPERVWAEISRGLIAGNPARMVTLLKETGALARIAPGAPAGEEALAALDRAAKPGVPLAVRLAVWLVAGRLSEHHIKALCSDLKTPADVRDYATQLALLDESFRESPRAAPKQVLFLIERLDGLRRGARFGQLLEALVILHPEDVAAQTLRTTLEVGLRAVRDLDAVAIARNAVDGDVAAAMHSARLNALYVALGNAG
jgi:tRNA nucleotidyltransferase (CCA-adding enzyme)